MDINRNKTELTKEEEEKYNSYSEITNDWYENQLKIEELQSLKQKGEVVERSELYEDMFAYNSLEYLKSIGFKLIKKV